MSTAFDQSSVYSQLRNEAESRLKAGTTAASNWSLGVDALQMLHKLSSNPQTAADALKLLHELQVHQVELDLQSEEMRSNEHRSVEELSRYKTLYEFAPVGYLLVNFHGEVIESNRAAAELFDVAEQQLTGGRIDRFLALQSRPLLSALLQRVEQGDGPQTSQVILESNAGTVRVVARASPDKVCVLLACFESR